MGSQYDVHVDHIRQGNASDTPAFVSITQSMDHDLEHSVTTNANTHPSTLDKAAGYNYIRNNYPSPDASLLQVPSNKRQRTSDNHQRRESQSNAKRQKTLPSAPSEFAVMQPTTQERPTDSRSSHHQIEAICNFAKDSGASEEVLSTIRALNIRGKGSTNDHQMDQVTHEDTTVDTKKKKPIECDQCHKKMARRCDLR